MQSPGSTARSFRHTKPRRTRFSLPRLCTLTSIRKNTLWCIIIAVTMYSHRWNKLKAMSDEYTTDEQAQLLALARQSLRAAAAGESRPRPDLEALSPRLCEQRACFVTLTMGRAL